MDAGIGVEDRLEVGAMVSCDGGEEIWSVVGVEERTAQVQVMEEPGRCRERVVTVDRCRTVSPSPGQDCFAYVKEHWVEGRIYSDHVEDGERKWSFLTGEEDARIVPPELLRFRSADFRRDPAVALGNWIVDKPNRFELRGRFLGELDLQRRLSGGCTALLASKIEIYTHQVEVVSRVLEDPIHRFILADEVGLGKTIEAGLILRQRFMDGLARRALVLVPDHLKGQWESELQGRFGLVAPRVEIRTFSSMASARGELEQGAWSDLVVDEAHHAASWGGSDSEEDRGRFECLARLADQVDGLLLLSATPQETTPQRLLALLELLDPDVHSRRELDQFQRRLDLRDTVLDVLRMIENEESAIFYADELRTIAAGVNPESPLRALLGSIADGADDGAEPSSDQIAEVRTQFRETFRLHNRLIRSSRTSDRLIAWRAPQQGVGHARHFADMLRAPRRVEQQAAFEEGIRDWQLRAIQHGLDAGVAGTMISSGLFAACMGAEAIRAWCALRRGVLEEGDAKMLFGQDAVDVARSAPEAPWEATILEDLEEIAGAPGWFKAKARAARDAVLELADAGGMPGHVVVFTTTSGAAEALGEFLRKELEGSHPGEFEVVALGTDTDECEVMDTGSDLHGDPRETLRVVCASPRVEEGSNLQGAHRVVHFDIPRNLPSLEQRIGRLDRIGQTRTLQQVLLLPSTTSSRASLFVQEVLIAFSVMSESISGVQGSAEDHLKLLDQVHMEEAQDMGAVCEQIRDDLESERRARARERELDAAASADWRIGVDIEGIIEHETAVRELQSKVSRALQKFIGLANDHRGPLGSYRQGRHATVTLSDAEERSLGRLLGNKIIPTPGTFDRRQAVRHPEFALRRAGDPLIGWSERFLRSSGQGSAYAVIRQTDPRLWQTMKTHLGWESHSACWVFSYAVSPGALPTEATDRVRVRRFMPVRELLVLVREEDPAFPVTVAWADEGIPEEDLSAHPAAPPLAWFNLRQYPYKGSKITAHQLAVKDIALKPGNRDFLGPFISQYGWGGRATTRAEQARASIDSSDTLKSWVREAVGNFEQASLEHERILRMRIHGEADLEVEARGRVIGALTNPVMTLRSAGFVLLTGVGV